jgi:hypothetical protein
VWIQLVRIPPFPPLCLSSIKSANKVQSLFFPLPLWHKVVQGIPATLQEHLEAIEQSVTQLHAVTLLNSWHGRIHFYDVFIIISPVGNS